MGRLYLCVPSFNNLQPKRNCYKSKPIACMCHMIIHGEVLYRTLCLVCGGRMILTRAERDIPSNEGKLADGITAYEHQKEIIPFYKLFRDFHCALGIIEEFRRLLTALIHKIKTPLMKDLILETKS